MPDVSFLAALHGANTQSMMTTKTEGEDFRDSFRVDRHESSGLYLYKNNSGKEEGIIQTFGRRAQSGRHTVRYDGELFVVITELALSDAGQYRFGVSNSSSQGSFKTFELRIKGECCMVTEHIPLWKHFDNNSLHLNLYFGALTIN